MIKAISPNEVTKNVEKLLDLMDAEFDPEFVKVEVDDAGKVNNCYLNVEAKVKRDGGKVHYGWAIWQSQYLCEAEHHAVWEDQGGQLLDITPRADVVDHIMFVSDQRQPYFGQSIDNIRLNTSGNPVIDHFILICQVVEKMYTYGTRRNDEEIAVPAQLSQIIGMYEAHKNQLLLFASEGKKLGSPCFCGSTRAYSKCHGSDVKRTTVKHLKEIESLFGKGQ